MNEPESDVSSSNHEQDENDDDDDSSFEDESVKPLKSRASLTPRSISKSNASNRNSKAKAGPKAPAKAIKKASQQQKLGLELGSDNDDSNEYGKAETKPSKFRQRSPAVAARSVLDSLGDSSEADESSNHGDIGSHEPMMKARVLKLNQTQQPEKKMNAVASSISTLKQVKVEPAGTKPPPRQKSMPITAATLNDHDSYDIVLPPNWSKFNAECTLLVQIDASHVAESSRIVDLTGAVGRLEVDSDRVRLDLKGTQYSGRIYPGPTALLVSVVAPSTKNSNTSSSSSYGPWLRVEGMTDEFCSVTKRGDSLSQMFATGNMDNTDEDDYDEDVNRATVNRKTDVDSTNPNDGAAVSHLKKGSTQRSKPQARPKRSKKTKR